MLSSADRELIERDSGLPGLRTLFNPAAFVTELTDVLPKLAAAQVQIYYLRYKPGANCLAKFRLDLNGETIWGYAKTYGDDASTKFTKACQRATVPTPIGPGRVLLVGSAIEVVLFPNDSKLETLQQLSDETGREAILKRLLPNTPDLWNATLTGLSYKPERRFVARLDVDGEPRAVLKLYTEREFQRARNNSQSVQSAQVLQLPDQMGSSSHDHIVLLNWLPGTPLQQIITSPSVDRSLIRNVGAALAEFHNQGGKGLGKQKPKNIRGEIHSATAGIRFTCPDLETLAFEIDERLGRLVVSEQPELSAIHGDFYADQVLADGERVAIIDLDNTIRGNPASDLGLFIAHLERNVLSEARPKAPVSVVRDALIEGYQTARDAPSRAQVDLHTAAGLVQLAPHHFRNREPAWSERTGVTLRRAMEIIDDLPTLSGAVSSTPAPVGVAR